MRLLRAVRDERGSSPVEFVLVGALLTALTLGVLQFALAVYVRNVVHDAAVEGAYHAALADTTLNSGADTVRDRVASAVGTGIVNAVGVREAGGVVQVTVHATMPLLGLIGVPGAWEVTAHAPLESFE